MDECSETKHCEAAKFSRWPGRLLLFFVFLGFLLCTPVIMMLCSSYPGFGKGMLVLMLILGSLGAGYTLAKIYAKQRWLFWSLGIVFSLCVLAIWAFGFLFLSVLAATFGCGC